MNSIPADVQRRLDLEDLCHRILEHEGLESYSEVLNFVSGTGGGRIAAMQWQVIFQHLLIRRRVLVQGAALNFYEFEKKATAAVKRLGVDDPHLTWLLVYLYTRKVARGDSEGWDYAVGIIKEWLTSS